MSQTTATDAPSATRHGPAPALHHRRRSPLRWVVLGAAALIALLMLAPFWLLVLNAFKTGADYSTNGPMAWPETFTLDAFAGYLALVNFPMALWNSILISTVVAFAGTALALISAVTRALVRRFRQGRGAVAQELRAGASAAVQLQHLPCRQDNVNRCREREREK